MGLAAKTVELAVVWRLNAVEIDEFLQKQLRLEGAIVPLAPIVAEPRGKPSRRPLLDLVAFGRQVVWQVQDQIGVPAVVCLQDVPSGGQLRRKEPPDVVTNPHHGGEKFVPDTRPYVLFCGQLVGERRHRQWSEELAHEQMLVEGGWGGQARQIAIFGFKQVCAMDKRAEKVFPRVEIDAPQGVLSWRPQRPFSLGNQQSQLSDDVRSDSQR